jgi:hypothetical protein
MRRMPECGATEEIEGFFARFFHEPPGHHVCVIGRDINHSTHYCKNCKYGWKNVNYKPERYGFFPFERFGEPSTPFAQFSDIDIDIY